MAETPTPRTDALGEYPESWLIRHPEVLKHRLLCFSLETDLQHLARVAGEALAVAIGELYHHSKDDAIRAFSPEVLKWAGGICHELGSNDINVEDVYSKVLSEIQRIKNQTI